MANSTSSQKGRQTGHSSQKKGTQKTTSKTKAMEAKMKEMKAELLSLRKAVHTMKQENNLIPRPPRGVAGDGYNLQAAMEIQDDTELYKAIRRCVRTLVGNAGLDPSVIWNRQPSVVISQIIRMAQSQHTYLKRFHNGWAVQEFIKSHLKNRRAYAQKCGYTTEIRNTLGSIGDDDKDYKMDIDLDDHEGDGVDSGDEGGEQGDGENEDEEGEDQDSGDEEEEGNTSETY
ncbi:hypothetical protein BDZ94DRAFT_1318888 [Collybia nuda]|uniref:Uncharacterized protein n=1 Tax=Collybia nuda TaxID=64659 RepID=A0A9P5YG67_9AGAR|nr:hypothetical protein BDZ94DRAFT_1318888 [Collybia nuda]